MMRFAIALALVGLVQIGHVRLEAADPEAVVVYRRAALETMAKAGRLENATLVIRGNKIEAVGADVKIPDNAQIIDAAGQTIMPGLIEPLYEVAIAGPAADAAPRTMVIRGRVVQIPSLPTTGRGFTRVADSFYPYDPGLKPLNRMGLTTLNLITNGMGQSAMVQLTPQQPDQMLWKADGVVFASVTNNTESLDQLRTRLDLAGRGRTTGGPSGAGGPTPTRPGPGAGGGMGGAAAAAAANLQVWRDLVEGKTPLVVSASNSATILYVLKLVETHKNLKLVIFASGDSLYEAREALKGRPVKIVLQPGLDMRPNSRDRMNVARLLHEDGHEFSFSLLASSSPGPMGGGGSSPTDQFLSQDFPLFPVAYAVKTGLPRQAALAALTQRPASLLGLDKEIGTLEPGKLANLLIIDGDPLDPRSRLRATMIEGKTVYAR